MKPAVVSSHFPLWLPSIARTSGRFFRTLGIVALAGMLSMQFTLFATAQGSERPIISVDNATDIVHLAEVEVTDWVGTVAFSPDGSHLISDRGDPSMVYWSLDDLTPLGEPLVGHSRAVTSLALSPDGTLLASAGEEGAIRFWDAVTREPLTEPLSDHQGGVSNVAFSPDGSRLASFGYDANLILWDTASLTIVANEILESPGDWSCELAFSPDGNLLATSGETGVIHLWDAATLEPVADLEGHSGWSCAKAFSPDGTILATGDSGRGLLIFWDVATHEMIGEPLPAHPGQNFFSLTFSPDGTILASSGSGGFRLWDVASKEPLNILPKTPPRAGNFILTSTGTLAFSPDGTLLAAGLGSSNPSGEVHLWGIDEPE
ncbi:MAG: WD40 repeat domain-containing protein [Trueperaceae bacterium]|nr:MAG: WD40 repeat domain-containing protein [Trueperaceae bacterium]